MLTDERQKVNNINSTYLITADTTMIFSTEFKLDGNAASIFLDKTEEAVPVISAEAVPAKTEEAVPKFDSKRSK